jgi:hypothetical protein
MTVTSKKKVYDPVSITFDTRRELELFTSMLGSLSLSDVLEYANTGREYITPAPDDFKKSEAETLSDQYTVLKAILESAK